MNRISRSRSGLILTELLFAILFFALGSAASTVRYTDGSLEALSVYYPYAKESGDEILVFYNGEQEQSDRASAAYVMSIRTDCADIRKDAVITLSDKNGRVIYELHTLFPTPDQSPLQEELP